MCAVPEAVTVPGPLVRRSPTPPPVSYFPARSCSRGARPRFPSGRGEQTATEFAIDPAKLHDVFAADLAPQQAAVLAATQRPVAEAAFTDPSGPPAWKRLPSWAVVATGDKAAGTDVVRSMAQRAGAEIVELDGSHVIMISRPEPVADLIGRALAAVAAADVPAPRHAQQADEPAVGRMTSPGMS